MRPTVLLDLIDYLPAEAAVWRVRDPAAAWTLGDHLIAHVGDLLALANWQRAGDENARRPDQIPRPGVVAETEQITGDVMTLEQTAEWLGWSDN